MNKFLASVCMLVFAIAFASSVVAPGARAQVSTRAKGGGGTSEVLYQVSVVAGTDTRSYQKPLYMPATQLATCVATTNGKSYSASFPRHDLCATLVTDTGNRITDDITIQVITTKGMITSVIIRGQDVIGEAGIMHQSETIPILPPATPSTASFTLHVHTDNIPLWRLQNHTGGPREEIVGYFSLGDMVFQPL